MRLHVTKQFYTEWEFLTPPAKATATTIATVATTVTKCQAKIIFIEKSAFLKVYFPAASQTQTK